MKELEELGKRVRAERIAAGLKQRELADRAAISVDSLSSLENGRPVSTATLQRVLRALGHGDALGNLLPPPVVSPIDMQKLAGKQRQRVR
jgi:transcriptional regulator with XRE-family HTH domain